MILEVEVAEQERPSIRLLPDDSDKIFKTGVTFQIICEADFNLDWKLPSILETRDYVIHNKSILHKIPNLICLKIKGSRPEERAGRSDLHRGHSTLRRRR